VKPLWERDTDVVQILGHMLDLLIRDVFIPVLFGCSALDVGFFRALRRQLGEMRVAEFVPS
jgi:hypothetical protein